MLGYLCINTRLVLVCLPSGSTDVTPSPSQYTTPLSRIPILSPVLFMHVDDPLLFTCSYIHSVRPKRKRKVHPPLLPYIPDSIAGIKGGVTVSSASLHDPSYRRLVSRCAHGCEGALLIDCNFPTVAQFRSALRLHMHITWDSYNTNMWMASVSYCSLGIQRK